MGGHGANRWVWFAQSKGGTTEWGQKGHIQTVEGILHHSMRTTTLLLQGHSLLTRATLQLAPSLINVDCDDVLLIITCCAKFRRYLDRE